MERSYLLSDPYMPRWSYREIAAVEGTGAVNTVAWPIANTAFYLPVQFPASATLYQIAFAANNGTGNYDLGFYDSLLNRIASAGSTAMTAAGVKTLALPEYRVGAGRIYYAALVLSSTSGQLWRTTMGNIRDIISVGCGIQATALPLPDPAVPVTVSSGFGGIVPLFTFGVR